MIDDELKAIKQILKCLDGLDPVSRNRVMRYVFDVGGSRELTKRVAEPLQCRDADVASEFISEFSE